jgi:glutamate-5-semialdehyde dehydrogenase
MLPRADVGKITMATMLDDGLELYRVTCPVGVICIIFEARPECCVQISSLCLKSGMPVSFMGEPNRRRQAAECAAL